MKIIRIKRIKQYGETTVGKLTISGESKKWFVLEPGGPDSRVAGSDKRIEAGTYKLVPYSSAKYKNVYELKNVPGRTKILIHPGNFHDDTEGCLMPGHKWGFMSEFDKQYKVSSSRAAFKEIASKIKNFDSIIVIITNSFEK